MRLSDIMAAAGLSGWAEAALVLFLAAFVTILIAVMAPSRRQEFDRLSRLPLDDDSPFSSDANGGTQ